MQRVWAPDYVPLGETKNSPSALQALKDAAPRQEGDCVRGKDGGYEVGKELGQYLQTMCL